MCNHIIYVIITFLCTKNYDGLFTPIIMIGNTHLIYYLALFVTSQFPYIVGVLFADKKLYSRICNIFNKFKLKNIIPVFLILAMIIAHGFVQSLFITVFTGIGFNILSNIIDETKLLVVLWIITSNVINIIYVPI